MVAAAGGPDSASAIRASLAKTVAFRCAETELCWGARSATTATTGRMQWLPSGMMDAVAAKWNADGTAVRASAQGYAETGCARVQRIVTTGTRFRGMDAAGTAWWRWGTHAAGPRRTGNAGNLATRAWEDAEMARVRKGRQVDVCRGLVREEGVQTGVRGRDCDCGARAVRRRQLVGIQRMQRVMHGGLRMGLQRGEMHGDLRRRDAQWGRGVRRREHGVGRWMQLRVQCVVGVCM